ncbi:hypothetical protein N431DRAFT_436586 [Stipitochalara longipes BDJ]|nr:hypothetical protein N431DRAFT_436586 [Stipitochalara longipes BDJ]
MCPPGTDQTMRTAQVWCFLAPEIKQAFKPEHDEASWRSWYSFKMSDMLFDNKDRFDAWSLLARPVTPQPAKIQLGSLGAFDVLSNEILEMVIDHIDDNSDVMALGLSCEGFWQMIQRHIHRCYIKAAAPWAGTKIAFQGSYCYDLPAPFLGDGLLESLDSEHNFGGGWHKYRQFFWLHQKFGNPVGSRDVANKWIEAANSQQGSGIPLPRWEEMQKDIACHDLFPKDRSWLLRNLTTKETVHSGLSETRLLRSGKNREGLKFEDVLMMKICWTSYASHGDEQLNLHRGVWAGHRFDIVTSETHSKEENVEDWKDITDSVVKDLVSLRSKLGR